MPIKSIAVPVKPKKDSHRKSRKAVATVEDAGPSPSIVIHRAVPAVVAHPVHRYRVGERLLMVNGGRTIARSAASCVVIARLPFEGRGHLLYRVRSDAEQYERVVPEMDLSHGGDFES